MRVAELFAFAHEREMVRQRRAAGLPRPWTDDPILQKYRFTATYREDDAVTTWLRLNWREPHTDDPDMWFAMVVARHINNIPCLSAVPFPLPWNREALLDITSDRKRRKLPVFGPAYMISTNGKTALDKMTHICDWVLDPLWKQREQLRPRSGDTLCSYHIILGQLYGLASFLAGQVVADTKYTGTLQQASDWWTFCCSGPGSRRGLNRLLDRPKETPWREDDWRLEMVRLREEIVPMFAESGLRPIDSQSLQSLCCEWDKRCRVAYGEAGRPKQLFPGAEGGSLPWSRSFIEG